MPLFNTKAFYRRFANLGKNLSYRDSGFSPDQGKSIWETCPQLAALDPAVAFTFFDDFYEYVQNNSDQQGWIATIVEAGAGNASITIGDSIGGKLIILNDDADNDSVELQWNDELFKLVANKPLWFETYLKVSSAQQSDLLIGLCITDTTLIAGVTDGVYWRKDDNDTQLDIVTIKNSTATETANVATLLTETYTRLGFVWDGVSKVIFFINGVEAGSHTTNICDDEELTVSMAFQNGEAAAKTMTVDYVKVIQMR